ncbi:glutamate receptor ionotropic, NMDA 2C-like [Clytia hemisphaerica]|uniref:Ionotropic glutamate receptor C-terminal domain-containing protein n=2 Tax=Clytia hemisphaerica TaxID=252671 RepID=A0A7M5TVS9_9CNID
MDMSSALVTILVLIFKFNTMLTTTNEGFISTFANQNYYGFDIGNWSSLNQIHNLSLLRNCTLPLVSSEELLERAINFLQQEDDFNQLVIIANKTFDIQTQNENKQITFYVFQELNETILGVIANEIIEELKSRKVLLIVDDTEWKMVQNFVEIIRGLHEDHLFWIRIISTTIFAHKYSNSTCAIQLPINASKEILSSITQSSRGCLEQKEQKLIRAVSSFHDHYLFDVPQAELYMFGELYCQDESYLCQKPLDNSGYSWQQTCCSGLYADLAAALFEHTGHSWILYGAPDGAYGGFSNCSDPEDLTTCQWNGMVNELREGRADIAIAAMTITEARTNVVEFTENIFVTRLAIALRNEPEHLKFANWKFAESLDPMLILSLPVLVIVSVASLYFLGKVIKRTNPPTNKYPIKESFSYGAGLTFQRDLAGKTPDDWSARIVAIAYAVGLTIITSTYMANLTATNILKESMADFKGMYDEKITNPTSDFTYGVVNSSATAVLLKSSSTWRKAYSEFVQIYLTKSIKEGMAKVYDGQLDAFIAEYSGLSTMQGTSPSYCEKIILKEESFATPGSFATQRNSHLNQIFSKAIRHLKDTGVISQLLDKWMKTCPHDSDAPKAFQFEFEYAGGMVILVGIFLLIALVVFILETIYVHWRTKNPRKETGISNSVTSNT